MKRQGWLFPDDGAQWPASRIVRRVSSLISSSVKARGDHRFRKKTSTGCSE
jgi:hypothetical protein